MTMTMHRSHCWERRSRWMAQARRADRAAQQTTAAIPLLLHLLQARARATALASRRLRLRLLPGLHQHSPCRQAHCCRGASIHSGPPSLPLPLRLQRRLHCRSC